MGTLSSSALLEIWECGKRCTPQERALHLLAWALPDQDLEALADIDLGLRDWHLLRLQRALFGPRLTAHGDCPHCGERIEVELDARELQADTPPPAPAHYVDSEGRRYRLPTSRDLISVARMHDLDDAAHALFVACCVDPEDADAGYLAEVEHGLSALAAERNLELALRCVLCGGTWQLAFEPGAFCWAEIDARAQTLLNDVHSLAKAHGWSERDILALSEARRAAYLERIQ